jgi:acyl-CoA synthetase (AMP-forming)/AMP-acid ligase II
MRPQSVAGGRVTPRSDAVCLTISIRANTLSEVSLPRLAYEPTTPGVLRRAVGRFGDRPCIVTAHETLTFRDLERRSRVFAETLLRSGIGKGSRVAMHLPNGVDWVVAWSAVTRIGALAMPLSTLATPRELAGALRQGDARLLIAPGTMFGEDHEAFLERAIEGLAEVPASPLHLLPVPYLRAIMVIGAATRPWGTSTDLGRSIAEPIADAVLAAVEQQVVPADECLVVFTSGSTRAPKAVVHTHGAVFRKASLPSAIVPPPGGCAFVGHAFFWIGGILNLAAALQSGATIACQERPDTESALALIERSGATAVMAWPTTVERLRSHPSLPRRNLRHVPQLSAAVPSPELRHGSLGMTETLGPHTAGARPGDSVDADGRLPPRLQGSFGAPLPFLEHVIVDPVTGDEQPEGVKGEICVRGFSLMTRMYKLDRGEVFDGDGWYHTGDEGFFRDGYLFFTGRLTDMIKTHGANVSPREVELALESLPQVEQAFVMGVPEAERGEIVAAALVAAPGQVLEIDGIRRALARELAGFKIPRRVVVLDADEVPWLATGKPDRVSISDRLRNEHARDGRTTVASTG